MQVKVQQWVLPGCLQVQGLQRVLQEWVQVQAQQWVLQGWVQVQAQQWALQGSVQEKLQQQQPWGLQLALKSVPAHLMGPIWVGMRPPFRVSHAVLQQV